MVTHAQIVINFVTPRFLADEEATISESPKVMRGGGREDEENLEVK